MVKLMTDIILNPEYEELQKKFEDLSERYANELFEYSEYTTVVRKNLEMNYLMVIGKKEYRLFSLKIQILRLKREMSLMQAEINQGRSLDKRQIYDALQQEFEEYECQMEAQREKIEQAQEYALSPKLSEEKNSQISAIYHRLVKRLHPDINPDLPPEAAVLWQRVLRAHSEGDWQELILLSDLVDEVLQDSVVPQVLPNTMEELQSRIQQLEEKLSSLEEKRAQISQKPPFCYKQMLSDPVAVMARRTELDQQIAEGENTCERLQKILDALWQTM